MDEKERSAGMLMTAFGLPADRARGVIEAGFGVDVTMVMGQRPEVSIYYESTLPGLTGTTHFQRVDVTSAVLKLLSMKEATE